MRERISHRTISSRGAIITSTAREQEALQNCERIIRIYLSVRNDEVKVKFPKTHEDTFQANFMTNFKFSLAKSVVILQIFMLSLDKIN